MTRAGCSHCAQLRAGPLCDAEDTFGNELHIEERTAGNGVPTPTLVVLGQRSYFMVGVPSKEQLVRFVRRANVPEIPARLPAGVFVLGYSHENRTLRH